LLIPLEERRPWIDSGHLELSISRQCELLGLARSSWYYEPMRTENEENLRLMRVIDKVYTEWPFFGYPRITNHLRELKWVVNEKRVARLMRVMGLQATLPGPHTSRPHPEHKIYPYLLKGLQIKAPNEVWCADITYVPMHGGHMFLVAVMDWFSRYVLAWELSNTLESEFCSVALKRALEDHGPPGISNTDQGSQFTSDEYIDVLKAAGIRISMDGKGRALDNAFIERLWRSVKYEDIYLRDYRDGIAAREGIDRYFRFYNTKRPHSSHGYRTPEEVHFGGA
jgi:putative transposase